VTANASSLGGAGGSTKVGGIAGVGGAAFASVDVTSAETAYAYGSATGGTGGGGAGSAGGSGGTASVSSIRAVSTNGGAATAYANLATGAGGSGSSSGTAPDATLSNAVFAATTGTISLTQRATGGNGGNASAAGLPAGNGGNASSTLQFADSIANTLGGYVSATGGARGFGSTTATNGIGGNAVASINLIGNRVSASSSAAAGALGSALATANSTSLTGSAFSDAMASGSSGAAQGSASTSGGIVTNAAARGSVPLTGNLGHVQFRSAVARPAPIPAAAAGIQAAAFLTALPGTSDSITALTSSPNTHHDFNVAGEGTGQTSNVLALIIMGGTHVTGGSISQTGSSTVSESIDVSQLASQQNLLIGFLQPTLIGPGFDSLHFQIMAAGMTVANQTFTDTATALSYFTDNTLDLGKISSGMTGSLDLSFQYDLTEKVGGGFTTSFLVANSSLGSGPASVPEPAAFAPLAFAMIGLTRRRRAGK
jgi:MYXO-CTERM domain-containing protein